jgi:hypothetical protein
MSDLTNGWRLFLALIVYDTGSIFLESHTVNFLQKIPTKGPKKEINNKSNSLFIYKGNKKSSLQVMVEPCDDVQCGLLSLFGSIVDPLP